MSGELTTRVDRLTKDANEVIMMSLDGTFTWRGAVIGRVEKGDTVLNPRVVLLADEHLTGAPRDAAEARLAKWLGDRITAQLGPLQALEADEGIAGMARGVAFQLGEALGILERPRVAEEVRALSQDDRALLRKHGVRFGAHHIYLPVLLKPGPRVLAAQLWALHHGGLHQPGLDDLAALVQSGRMSVTVEPGTARGLYRAFGFRACGGRAVRIDILERIADLIRAALSWRPANETAPPPGAVDGRAFSVSEQMTSLAGCSGDDFAEILKALGYRSERRPAPARVETPKADTASPEAGAPDPARANTAADTTAAASGAESAQAAVDTAPEIPVEAAGTAKTAPEPVEQPLATAGAPAPEEAPNPAPEAVEADASPATEAAATANEPAPVAPVENPVEAPVDAAASKDGEAPAEPAEIIVWRPGRRPDAPRRGKPPAKTAESGQGEARKPRRGGAKGGEHKGGEHRDGETKGRKGARADGRKGRKGDHRGDHKGPRPDNRPKDRRPPKEPDPLSPFAALKDLRDTLADRGRRSDA